MAHRGGAGLWPENTLYAFGRAVALGVDVLEMDMHATADGELVIIHDASVGRTTNGAGRVNELTLAQLKRLDAAYRWTTDGGRSFPLRGRGVVVPTLREVFAAFPRARFNIDIKQVRPSVVRPFCRVIREHAVGERVTVASFSSEVLEEFRRECPEVATSAGPSDLGALLAGIYDGRANGSEVVAARVVQVPEYAIGRRLLTREFVEAAHRRGLEVHAWTINDETAMRRLLDAGVDGIITDFPDRLLSVLSTK